MPSRFWLLAAFAASLPLSAQETITSSTLTGRVVDPTGAAVPQAEVTAISVATNQSFHARTDGHGRFQLLYLPVGAYRVDCVSAGLIAPAREVVLSIGSAFDLNLQLALRDVSSTINVSGNSPVVEVSRSQIAETVQQAEVQNLPFEGRNFLDLGLLVPGVSPTNTASTQTLAETSEVVGQGYSVNSQRNFSNSFIVDGLSNNDDAAGVAGNVLSMDVVREFQVVTSGGQAEFGRALGGYFNLVTKSGSNQVHGTAYGFLRNQRLNAANALSRSTLPLTQGQYGVSLSGPLRRDRTFLFGNFEEQRLRTIGIITVAPANAAAINAKLIAVGYQAPLLPVANSPTSAYPTTLHTDTVFLRGDHRFNDKDRLEARYSFYQLSSLNARGAGSLNEVSNGTSVYDTNHTFALSNIATLTPHLYNETRGQFIYDDLSAPPNDQTGPAVTISGIAIFGRSTSSPTARLNYLGEVVDNVMFQRGSHTVKAGADFLYNQNTITFPMSLRGAYTFSSLASFLAGTYNNGGFTQVFGTPLISQGNPNLGVYAQDEWKVSSALTLNLGVRYDLEFLKTIRTDTNNLSPRAGFAWSPFGDNRTVVRGSYGLFYDRVPLRPLANALLSANNTTDYAQANLLSYTYSPTQAGAPRFPAVATTPPAGAVLNFSTMQGNLQNPYSQQASLGLEQQVGAKGSLGVNYQHVRGEHLISSYNTNLNANGSRPDPTRGNIKPYSSAFDSYFDGLEVSFLERPASWGSLRVSYTWSHAIDNVGEFFFSSPVSNFDFGMDRARSDDDQRHRVAFDTNLTTSTRPAATFAGHLTHNWRLSGTLQYYSRLPFNITTGQTSLQQTTQRPCISGRAAGTGAGQDLACYQVLPGTVIGRNAGVSFDTFLVNARLGRTFALTERLHLETMAEAFNLLNHRNDLLPNGTWGTGAYPFAPSPGFGQANAVGDPRNVQLAARISF